MNYELAKQLKDAGFPNVGFDYNEMGEDVCISPDLSELIEACGKDFQYLVRYSHTDDSIRWGCWTTRTTYATNGKTPEEAVAKLWLALNTHA